MTRRQRLGRLGIFAGIVTLVIGAAGCRTELPGSGQLVAPVSFKTVDGQVMPIRQFSGRVLLVDFWSTTCAICLSEMPSMHEIAQTMASQGLSVVTVAMPYDRPDHVLHAVKTRNIKLPVALDIQGEIVKALGPVSGTPTRVLIDRQGKIIDRMVGAVSPEKLRARLRDALNGPGAPRQVSRVQQTASLRP